MDFKEVKLTMSNSQTIFNNYFRLALRNDGVYINKKYLMIRMTEENVRADFTEFKNLFGLGNIKVNFEEFTNVFGSTLERIFTVEIPKKIGKGKINLDEIEEFYYWNNPIFDQMPHIRDVKKEMIERIKKDIEEDKEYRDEFAQFVESFLNRVALKGEPIEKQVDFYDQFGIVDVMQKIDLGYYREYSPKMLRNLQKEGKLTAGELTAAVETAIDFENYTKSKAKDNNPSKRNSELANILDAQTIIEMFLDQKLTIAEFSRTKVKKSDLLSSTFAMYFVINRDKFPASLSITSMDIVNAYGRTLNGNNIVEAIQTEKIEPEHVIELASINEALRHTDYDESLMFSDENINRFYSPKMMVALKMSESITPEFLEKYLAFMNFDENPELLHHRSQEMMKWIELYFKNTDKIPEGTSDEHIKEYVLFFYKSKLFDLETTKQNISEEYIEQEFLNDKISVQEISDFHDDGLISDETFYGYFTEDELINLYEQGKVNYTAMHRIKDKTTIIDMCLDKKMPLQDLLRLYFYYDNITAEDVEIIFGLLNERVKVADIIDEKVSFDKIKELFLRLIIDLAELTEILEQGKITQEQYNNLKKSLNTAKFFKTLEDGATYVVSSERQINRKGSTRHRRGQEIVPIEETDNDYREEIDLLSRIVGIDLDTAPHASLISYNAQGRQTSLNGYRIYGNRENGIVVLRRSKKENAVFLMSVEQIMYFLNGEENNDGVITIQDKMKDKAYLRTIKGVYRIEHDEFFGRNAIEAACRICPEYSEKLKDEDGKYLEDVDSMVIAMRERYFDEKAKLIDED